MLYDGKVKILKRHVKIFTEVIRSTEIITSFDEKTHYYLVKNNAFYTIGSKAAVIKILSDKKQELRRFSRENKFDFSKDEKMFVKLATHYDSLNP